jgi:membrane protein YqaA with SNARE-associated domain
MEISPRVKFLLSNGLKGLIWLAILLVGYFVFDKLVISKNPEIWIERFYSQSEIIYLIYIVSESFIGLFPPELFMIWAFNKGGVIQYVFHVAFFGSVSYLLGYINFLIGQFLYKHVIFRYFRKRYFQESWSQLRKYGLFLIIVAALTPVPWAAVCLLVGSANYPTKQFLIYALTRLLRFAIYGFVVYQTNQF